MPNNLRARGGFISIKGNYQADLADYYGFEIKVKNNRAENLRITVNMTCDSLIENDMFQRDVEILGGGDMSVTRIPFESFHLTSLGYDREIQRSNDSLQVQGIGILITSQLQFKNFDQVEYHQISEDDDKDDVEIEKLRRSKDFEFDLEILEISALTYIANKDRELDDRKEFLRQKMKMEAAKNQ